MASKKGTRKRPGSATLDWTLPRHDYVNCGFTERELSKKYNVPLDHVKKHAQEEGWLKKGIDGTPSQLKGYKRSVVPYIELIPPEIDKQLTDYQRRYVSQYLVDLNSTQAIIRAGYQGVNANAAAQEMRDVPAVSLAIAAAMSVQLKRCGYSNQRMMRTLGAIGFHDPMDVHKRGDDGELRVRDLEEMPPELRMVIAEIQETRQPDGTIIRKLKFYDRIQALRVMAGVAQLLKNGLPDVDRDDTVRPTAIEGDFSIQSVIERSRQLAAPGAHKLNGGSNGAHGPKPGNGAGPGGNGPVSANGGGSPLH